jgi:hypothetical protein
VSVAASGLATAAALLPAVLLLPSRWAAGVTMLCCGTACAWILSDKSPRYSSVCLLVLLVLRAVPAHFAFTTISPRRIVPFSAARMRWWATYSAEQAGPAHHIGTMHGR